MMLRLTILKNIGEEARQFLQMQDWCTGAAILAAAAPERLFGALGCATACSGSRLTLLPSPASWRLAPSARSDRNISRL